MRACPRRLALLIALRHAYMDLDSMHSIAEAERAVTRARRVRAARRVNVVLVVSCNLQ